MATELRPKTEDGLKQFSESFSESRPRVGTGGARQYLAWKGMKLL